MEWNECEVCALISNKVKFYKVVLAIGTDGKPIYRTVCHRCWLDWDQYQDEDKAEEEFWKRQEWENCDLSWD